MTAWTVALQLLCPCSYPGRNTGICCHFLLQGMFPTQGLNPGLLHCKQTLLTEPCIHLFNFILAHSSKIFSSCLHSLLLPPPLLASTCVIWWNFNSCLLLRSLIHAQQSALWFSFCSLVPKREKKLWDKLFPDAPPNSETRCSTKQ